MSTSLTGRVTVTDQATSADLSANLLRIDRWIQSTQGVGRFKIQLYNPAATYNGAIHAQDTILVDVQGAHYLKGYVDIAKPTVSEDKDHKALRVYEISGRDMGQDTLNKSIDCILNDHADNIIAQLIAWANTGQAPEITFTSPGTAPTIFEDTNGRQYLQPTLREILELIDYDGFVDMEKNWNMYPIGSVNSGITLCHQNDNPNSNVIRVFEHTEADATDLRNIVIVEGGHVNDSYTDLGNEDDWSTQVPTLVAIFVTTYYAGDSGYCTFDEVTYQGLTVSSDGYLRFYVNLGNGTYSYYATIYHEGEPAYIGPANFTITGAAASTSAVHSYGGEDGITSPRQGVSAIQMQRTSTGTELFMHLPFPKFYLWYLKLNLVAKDAITFQWFPYWHNYTGVDLLQANMWLTLVDTNGSVIHNTVSAQVWPPNWAWFSASFPIGYNVVNKGYVSNGWRWDSLNNNNQTFNWNVVDLQLKCSFLKNVDTSSYCLVDALTIPVNTYALAQDQDSINAYKARHLLVPRGDIHYQTSLQQYANSLLAKRKDPLETLCLSARGDIGLIGGNWMWQPGYACNVFAPDDGILNRSFRFVDIHSIIAKNVDNTGFDHIVELGMVPASQPLQTLRWTYSASSNQGIMRQLQDRIAYLEASGVLKTT